MAFIPTSQKPTPTMPVAREGVLHSEPTIYHPTAEENPETDKMTSSVPSAKKYLVWLAIGIVVFAGILLFVLK